MDRLGEVMPSGFYARSAQDQSDGKPMEDTSEVTVPISRLPAPKEMLNHPIFP